MKDISIIASLIASLSLFFMGVFVLIKDWRDQINRYYVIYDIGALGILSTMFLTYRFHEVLDVTLLNRITQASTVFFFASLLTMSLVFPKSEKKFPLWITALVLSPAIVVGGLIVLTDFSISKAFMKEGNIVREFRFFYPVYMIVAFLYLVSGMINFIRKYFQTKIEVYKLQMRYVFVGASLAIFSAAICSIILPYLFRYTDLYVIGPSAASVIATLAMFYSVVAYHLMDIRTVVHKTVMYGITSMVIIVPLYGLLLAYQHLVLPRVSIPSYIVPAMMVMVFILFMAYVQPLIDKLFQRRQYQFGAQIDGFLRTAEERGTSPDILKQVVDVLRQSLFLNHAFFLMLNESSRKYELTYRSGEEDLRVTPVDRVAPLIRWFVRNNDLLLLGRVYTDDKSFGEVREEIAGFFTANGVQLILPVYHDRKLLGLICLGEKSSLSGYSPDEIERLKHFRSRSNDLISASLTQEKTMKDQLVSRTLGLSSQILAETIPTALPNVKAIRFGAFLKPKYAAGTDYFDFIRPGEEGIGAVATDISGIGVNSALYSVVLRSAFQSCVDEAPSTTDVMNTLNRVLYRYSRGSGGLVTAFYFYFDFRSSRLMYTNAGYPAMELFRVEKNAFDSLDTEGIPLGYDEKASYGMGRTNLSKGDIGILFSKTLINSRNQKGESFGMLRVRSVVMENRYRQASEIAEAVKSAFESFMGLSLTESDILALVFKVA